ncbi:Clavaminate synthase-like protein [Tothia fuscella]|uniref:Clavaminate synthase-like protein n=1 Tax=Tothia fuscella TaxID=1048955 RepID=A0A9P4NG87_9PEZI|nr:Clavaminate synthase-like protein [Tothia fuscella]
MVQLTQQKVPVVDFGQFLNGSREEKQKIASKIDVAFRKVGFVYLSNHGVPQERVDECFEWSKKFFDLPTETKNLAPHPPGGAHHRGYSGLGVEKVSQNIFDEAELNKLRSIPDYKESFESGNVNDESQPNIWLPEDVLHGFRRYMESFFKDCEGLVHEILKALAISLELDDEEQLSGTHKQSLFQLRLLHYPPVPASLLRREEKSRISAHSDFGTLTLLFQDPTGGLEVESPPTSQNFIPVPPIPGTVLVNIGDLMERWSNGRWRSTVHRVVAPPADASKSVEEGEEILKPRYSIPFFATADPETVIEALKGTWDGEGNPKKFEKITAWGYVQMRMAALYS